MQSSKNQLNEKEKEDKTPQTPTKTPFSWYLHYNSEIWIVSFTGNILNKFKVNELQIMYVGLTKYKPIYRSLLLEHILFY